MEPNTFVLYLILSTAFLTLMHSNEITKLDKKFTCLHNTVMSSDNALSVTTVLDDLRCGTACLVHELCNCFSYNSTSQECLLTDAPELSSVESEEMRLCMAAGFKRNVLSCGAAGVTLGCEFGEIAIIEAKYGRTVPQTEMCPGAQAEVGCFDAQYQGEVSAACNGLTTCPLPTNIGDPCPNTRKYYNVTYSCEW